MSAIFCPAIYNVSVERTKKVITLTEFDKTRKRLGRKKIVLVGGCFDLLHWGHLQFLKISREQGGILLVALESDMFIRRHKKREPIHTQRQRAEILSSLRMVDFVLLLPYLSSDREYMDLVMRIKPSVIAMSAHDLQIVHKSAQARAVGATLKTVTPLLEEFSTKRIRTLLDI